MIKSTKTSLKFSNKNKHDRLMLFLNEYENVVSSFVDLLWLEDKIPTLLPRDITSQIDTWLSARSLQCAGKQASGIVRGTRKKQQKRKWMIDKFIEEREFKKARKLQKIYDEVSISKPQIDGIEAELDSRFVKIDLNNSTSFDGWISISSLGNKMKLTIPFKKTRHFNKLLKSGKIKSGLRLSKQSLTFMFDIKDPEKKLSGSTLGIDIGQNNVISCSNGFASEKNSHGHNLTTITNIMSRKKKGSKAFKKCESHRTNYVNWSINQLKLSGIKQINIERIKHLRRGKRTSRKLSHWTYTEIFDKLKSYCMEQGVLIHKVCSAYTSQRCSECGWTRKRNRKGKQFKCGKCGFIADSDLNAAMNISLSLIGISKKQRLKQLNRTGFYWFAEGQDRIVPAVC